MRRLAEDCQTIDKASMGVFVRPKCSVGGDCLPPTCEMHVLWLRTCFESLRDKYACVRELTGVIDEDLATSTVRVAEDFLRSVLEFATTGRVPEGARNYFMKQSTALFEQQERLVYDGSGMRYAVFDQDCELDAFLDGLLQVARSCAEKYGLDLHWHPLVRALQFEFNQLPRRLEGMGKDAQRQALRDAYPAAVRANASKPYPEADFCSQERWNRVVDEVDLSLSEPIFRFISALGYETEWTCHIDG
jgi:hypothetical protein